MYRTITIAESIQLTRWMEANHRKLVDGGVTRVEARNQVAKEIGIEVSENRLSEQAKGLGWTDWPSHGAGKRGVSDCRRLAQLVQAIYAELGGQDKQIRKGLEELSGVVESGTNGVHR